MSALLSDSIFYAGIIALFASLAAFKFLLKRYKNSAMAPSIKGPDPIPEPEELDPIKIVSRPADSPPKKIPSADPEPLPTPAPAPAVHPLKQAMKDAPLPKTLSTGQTVTGGISPAVIYLQNLKLQMEHFEKEIAQLRAQVSVSSQRQDKEFEILLKKLTELHAEMRSAPGARRVPPPPAVAPALKAAVPKPAAQPVPAAAEPKPEKTVPIPAEAVPVILAPPSTKTDEGAPLTLSVPSSDPSPAEDPLSGEPGKGPVWPV